MKIFTSFLRQLLVVFFLLFVFSFTVFGDTIEMTLFTSTAANMDDVISYSTDKGGGTTEPTIIDNEIRLYQKSSNSESHGGTITITAKEKYQINSVTIGSSMGTSVAYSVGESTEKSINESISKGGNITISDVNDCSITFYCMGDSKAMRLYVNYLSVTYSLDSSEQEYTVTFDVGNGVCATESLNGTKISLPIATPSGDCQTAGWEFAGWSETNIVENTENVVLVDNPYFPTEDKTLYAVYRQVVSSFEQIYTFTSTSKNTVSSSPSLPEGASVSFNNTYSDKAQMTKGNTQTWTITGLDIPLVAVSASMKTNKSAGNGSVKIKVGDDEVYKLDPYKSLYENSNQYSDKYFELTSIDKVGTIVVTINATVNSLYCQSLTITVADTEFLYSSNPNCVEIEEYIVMFGNLAIETENGKIANIPELPESCNNTYLTKVGWSTISTLGSTMDEPELVDENTFFTEDTQLYPVYSNGVKNNDWGIVTDVSELATNDEIIIVYDNKALGAQNSNYRSAVDLGVSGEDIINIGDATIISLIKHDDGDFAFQIPSEDNVYLVAPTADNNYLETNENIDNYAKWTISISDSVATITNVGNTNRYLQYNPSSSRFATYQTKSKQQNVFIYKRKVTTDVLKYYICGDITIESGEIYSVAEDLSLNTLTIKSNLDEAGEIVLDEDVVLSAGNVVVEKTIDASRWFFFSLPFDCNIADDIEAFDIATGNALEYLTNYSIFTYDQEKAAHNKGATGSKAWVKITDANTTLKANRGYIIGYLVDEGEAKIKFKSGEAKEITTPKDVEQLDLGEYTWYTEGEVATANGWNLIGLPYYQKMSGVLTPNFVSIPNPDGKTYTQIEYSNANISPFTSFFIQVAKDKIPAFTITAGEQNFAPMINIRSNRASLQRAVVTLISADGGEDRTTIINNPNTTTDYEIGYDLVKWIGYANIPQIYSIQGDNMLAFNSLAIDNSIVIPLGVYAHADGEYTFVLDEKSVGNEQDWVLYDNESGKTTCLVDNFYSIYLEKGTYEGRFELRMHQRVATSSDSAIQDIVAWTGDRTFNIYNLPIAAEVYIYDAVGRMIDIIKPNSALFSYIFSVHGVYNVVVSIADNRIVYKVVF